MQVTPEAMTRLMQLFGLDLTKQSEAELLAGLMEDTGKHFAQLVERCKRLRDTYPGLMKNTMFLALFSAAQDGRDNSAALADYMRMALFAEKWEESDVIR